MENVDTLVGTYVKCRDSLTVERKKFKALEKHHKESMDAIANKILQMADEQGVESFATTHGTAFKKKKDFIKVDNWALTLDYLMDNNLTHMLTKSVAKAAAKEYMGENNNLLPPGLTYGYVTEINVRRK